MTSLSKTIKVPLDSTMRVVATLAGFRSRHGRWPDALDMDPGLLAALATELLTPLGFFLLQSKLHVTTHVTGTLVARSPAVGEPTQRFEYGEASNGPSISSAMVADWLGWDDPASSELAEACVPLRTSPSVTPLLHSGFNRWEVSANA